MCPEKEHSRTSRGVLGQDGVGAMKKKVRVCVCGGGASFSFINLRLAWIKKKKRQCVCVLRGVEEGVALSFKSLQPLTSGQGVVLELLQLS